MNNVIILKQIEEHSQGTIIKDLKVIRKRNHINLIQKIKHQVNLLHIISNLKEFTST